MLSTRFKEFSLKNIVHTVKKVNQVNRIYPNKQSAFLGVFEHFIGQFYIIGQ
jgi:hypothetical protein